MTDPVLKPWEKRAAKAGAATSGGKPWEKRAKPSGPVTGRDGMTTAERIAAAKAGTLPQPSAAKLEAAKAFDNVAELQMNQTPTTRTGAFLGNVAPGLTFGFADEIAAGIGSVAEGRPYGEVLSGLRGQEAKMMTEQPVASVAGQVTGAVLSPISRALTPSTGVSLGGNVARGVATGAAGGALYGLGTGEGGIASRATNALRGAAGGAILGGALPVVGRYARQGVESLANSRTAKAAMAAAPSMDDLRAAASRIYQQADQVTTLPRADFAARAGGMLDDAARSGMDDMLTPGAARVAGKVDEAASAADPNIGFRELDILRKQAGVPAGNVANRTESSIGSRMVDGIDNYIDSVDPALSGSLKEARAMWGQLRRSEMVDTAIERAKNAASGFENGLRVEFRRILNNPKALRGFNETEIAAIKQVVQGTAMGNLMRQVGRIGIGLSGQSNGLGATVGGLGVAALSNPIAGAAAVGMGTVMKALAERSTRKAADRALSTVTARGALQNLPQASLPWVENMLSIGGRAALPQGSVPLGNALAGR